jgi:hypothetical protein
MESITLEGITLSNEQLNEVDKHNEENLKGSFLLVFVIGAVFFFLVVTGFMGVYMGLHPADGMAQTIEPEWVEETAPFDEPGLYQIGPNEYEARIVSFFWLFPQ